MENILLYGLMFCLLIFSLSVHEFAHARAAYYFGDSTAYRQGRMTMNPIKHIDPIGTIVLPLLLILFAGVSFGWAKPVPVNANVLGKKKMAWVAFAGPASNFILAIISVNLLYLLRGLSPIEGAAGPFVSLFMSLLIPMISINIALGIFNLIPVVPLDGSKIIAAFMSYTSAIKMEQMMAGTGSVIVMLLFFLTPVGNMFGSLVRQVTYFLISF